MSELSDLQSRLTNTMETQDLWPADSPWVRRAAENAPRHTFATDRVWDWDGDTYAPVDQARDSARWASLVYGGVYDSTITQVTEGLPTSSLSCEAVVADMLDSLVLEPGHTTLELGTATGRNAALLATRAGPGRVTSVEVDPQLAAAARTNLSLAMADVEVVVGAGELGVPGAGPFDRVMATYAVEVVPWAWVEQTRPGGRLVTPWGRLGHVALTVAPDGCSATGWMQGLATFMPARGTDQGKIWEQVRGDEAPDAEGAFGRTLEPLHRDANVLFALRVILPDIRIRTEADQGVTAWVHDGNSSWATIIAPQTGQAVAYQGGPRRLVTELEEAWQAWETHGAPGLYEFGMTRTPEEQYIWSNDPDTGPKWSTDAPALKTAEQHGATQ
ncbi:methyltransferase domain-containing protein [Streptomyces sioyaensis]|uniref:methyltransferase domain-containing protein n=1 Tax=Streptomyces sioyaensis TaxID=67364 RepID=UPI0037934E64